MAGKGTPDKHDGDDFEEMIKKVNENPDYKVLTVEEYEALLANTKTSTPKTRIQEPLVRPKTPNFTANSPTVGAGARLRALLNPSNQSPMRHQQPDTVGAGARLRALLNPCNQSPMRHQQPDTSNNGNFSFVAQPFNIPKLPFFSGSEEPQKGETTYEVWSFEVKCLQNSNHLPEHVLLQAIRNSLKGAARSMLVPLGENASVDDILNKLDGFYGNVSTTETLIQSFYNDFQKDTESIVSYGSRLEQTLSRAVRCGHVDFAAKDAMLRSKFWTGLKSKELRNSTRHLYDSVTDFQQLLKEIRKVEQEEVSSSRPAAKSKVAQQQSGQASADDSNTQLLKQMNELMSRMKTLEQKLESQQHSFQASSSPSHPSSFHSGYNSQISRGRGRGFQRGSWRGNFGRGYQNYRNFNNNNFQNQNDNFQNQANQGNNQNNRGSRGGFSRSGGRGGASGRGAGRGGSSKSDNQNLNY